MLRYTHYLLLVALLATSFLPATATMAGVERWNFSMGTNGSTSIGSYTEFRYNTPPMVIDSNSLYFVSSRGPRLNRKIMLPTFLNAVSVSGEDRWRVILFDPEAELRPTSLTVHSDTLYVQLETVQPQQAIFNTAPAFLCAFDRADGRLRWNLTYHSTDTHAKISLASDNEQHGRPVLNAAGDVLYFGAASHSSNVSGDVFAVNTTTGHTLWEFATKYSKGVQSGPILSSDGSTLYYGSRWDLLPCQGCYRGTSGVCREPVRAPSAASAESFLDPYIT
jgi:outer membrane protein assembly factor BamB